MAARPDVHGLRPANMLVSNVRGPDRPLYLNGARLEAMFPISTLIAGVGLNVTFMSYAGQVVFGFTGNGSALPEVETVAAFVGEAFAALEVDAYATSPIGSTTSSRGAYGFTSIDPTKNTGVLSLPRRRSTRILDRTTVLQEVAMTGTEFWALGYLSGMLMAWLMRKTERPPRANR